MAEVHKRYAQVVNKRQGWAGHLWQARFISYPMDEIYGYRATRYVELNPVRAGLMTDPGAYRWSSAAAHLGLSEDLLLGRNPFGMSNVEWSRYLAEGLIESEAELFREHARNERPLGGENFLKRYGLI